MTNEELAHELQDTIGLLMSVESSMRKIEDDLMMEMPLTVYWLVPDIESLRVRIVTLAQHFEPPLELEQQRVDGALEFLRETPHPPANRSEETRRRMMAGIEKIEEEEKR